tara:strand:- start:604 stop:1659 length:1056 start_codon:yes stop_codon:yes gene_type:complete
MSLEAILRTNPAMAGKKGYDKYGAPTVETKRKLRAAYEAKQNATQNTSNTSYPTDIKKNPLEGMGDYYVRKEGGLGGKATDTNKKSSGNAKTSSGGVKKSNSKYTKIFGDIAKQAGDSEYKKLMNKKAALDFRNRMDKKLQEQKAATSDSDKPIVGTTKAGRRRENRDNRKALRRARKSGLEYGTPEFDANVKAEKALIKKRRKARNEYLRNFASQLARGEQASPKPTETPEGMTTENFFDSNKEKTNTAKTDGQAATEQNQKIEKDNIETRLDRTKQQDNSYFGDFLNTSSVAGDLGNNYSLGDSLNFEPQQNLSLGQFQKKYTGIPKLDTEDSTPQSAMRKLYNKKRGL